MAKCLLKESTGQWARFEELVSEDEARSKAGFCAVVWTVPSRTGGLAESQAAHWDQMGTKGKIGKENLLVQELAFGELEALAGALLTVLLPLMFTRIAREESELL